MNCAIASDVDRPSRSFQRFCLKIGLNVAYFPVSDAKDGIADVIE